MKALAIARANLTRFLRDRSNIFFVFILPIGIVLLIGAQFGGAQATDVGVAGDTTDPVGAAVLDVLDANDEIDVRTYDSEEALLLDVERGNLAAGISIPPDPAGTIAGGATLEIGFVARPDGAGQQLFTVLDQAVAEATRQAAALRFAVARGADPTQASAVLEGVDGFVEEIEVVRSTAGTSLFEGVDGQFDIGASSQLVLFMFLTGLSGSAAIIQSRDLGMTRRMLGTPTGAGTVIAGEALGRFLVVFVQGLYIIAATILLFQVDWGDPLGAAATVVVFSAVGAGAALLLGTVFRNDQQAGGVGVVAGIGLAAFGGSMLPLELYGESMRRIAHITPHAWANDAFADLLRREATVVDILPELGALAAFAAALLAIATWRMRSVITR